MNEIFAKIWKRREKIKIQVKVDEVEKLDKATLTHCNYNKIKQ